MRLTALKMMQETMLMVSSCFPAKRTVIQPTRPVKLNALSRHVCLQWLKSDKRVAASIERCSGTPSGERDLGSGEGKNSMQNTHSSMFQMP